MLLLAVLFSFTGISRSFADGVERPKLVIGIAVDQMRWDYLYRYYDLYGEGGFKRLMRDGFNCENTMINYVPSVTAVGHASVYTGSVPSIHGIAGNSFMLNDKFIYCCDDSTVTGVGSDSKAGKMSPRNLLATTIGDELKVATNFKSKVVGVALKDRASILPAGHSADGAYWMDMSKGVFITSTYYMKQLPKWVTDYNKTIGKVTKEEISYSPLGNKLTEEMAKAAIAGERLGQNGTTDMLAVSFSCTDIIGHKFGTHSEQTREIYVDLDKRLDDFFTYLDQTIGEGQYLVFLTADHGAANNIKMLGEHGIPSGGFYPKKVTEGLETYLASRFGAGSKFVKLLHTYKIFLDHEAIAARSLDINDVKKAAVEWLKRDSQFAYVVDLEDINSASLPDWIREKIVNGYNRMRSGDIQLILNPGYYEIYEDHYVDGTTHGLWNPYDAHIPFLLMGWHIKPGSTQAKVTINDIAPTICSLIHIQMPNGCIGNPVIQVTK